MPDYVARVANEKAEFAWNTVHQRRMKIRPVLAADTTVTIDGKILGKPASQAEAIAMLEKLSGRTHQVLTGYCICCRAAGSLLADTIETDVRFKTLTEVEIDWYIQTGEPFDKAGGYGIQGRAAMFIEHLSGSYSGVMGLPLYETVQLLKSLGFEP